MSEPPQILDRRQHHECKHESTIIGLTHDRDDLKNTMRDISTKMDLILAQMTKVVVLEEKHLNSTADINRAHLYIANLEKQVGELSREVRDFISQAKGMSRMAWVVWTLLSGGLGMMLAKLFFFMPPNIPL